MLLWLMCMMCRGQQFGAGDLVWGGRAGARSWAVNGWAPAGLWRDSVRSYTGSGYHREDAKLPCIGTGWHPTGALTCTSLFPLYMSVLTHFYLVYVALTPEIQSFGRISSSITQVGRFKTGTTMFHSLPPNVTLTFLFVLGYSLWFYTLNLQPVILPQASFLLYYF